MTTYTHDKNFNLWSPPTKAQYKKYAQNRTWALGQIFDLAQHTSLSQYLHIQSSYKFTIAPLCVLQMSSSIFNCKKFACDYKNFVPAQHNFLTGVSGYFASKITLITNTCIFWAFMIINLKRRSWWEVQKWVTGLQHLSRPTQVSLCWDQLVVQIGSD